MVLQCVLIEHASHILPFIRLLRVAGRGLLLYHGYYCF